MIFITLRFSSLFTKSIKNLTMRFPETHKTRLRVVAKNHLTPHYVSIVFTADDVARFAHTTLGSNNKIFLPPPGQKDFELPDFDFTTMKWMVQDERQRPIVRTYTHRSIDIDKQTLTIDFALHDGHSTASAWADAAQLGDELGVVMATEAISLVPDNVQNYVFLCDASGLPATAALLERLPASAHAYVIAEVHGPEDELALSSPAQLDVQWLHNADPSQGSAITTALKAHAAIAQLQDSRFAHIAAEHATVRASRNFLRKEQGWTREECYACAYWQIGRREGESKTPPLMDD